MRSSWTSKSVPLGSACNAWQRWKGKGRGGVKRVQPARSNVGSVTRASCPPLSHASFCTPLRFKGEAAGATRHRSYCMAGFSRPDRLLCCAQQRRTGRRTVYGNQSRGQGCLLCMGTLCHARHAWGALPATALITGVRCLASAPDLLLPPAFSCPCMAQEQVCTGGKGIALPRLHDPPSQPSMEAMQQHPAAFLALAKKAAGTAFLCRPESQSPQAGTSCAYLFNQSPNPTLMMASPSLMCLASAGATAHSQS